MNLLLQRDAPDSVCTLGELFVDGAHECFTLERLPFDPENPATWQYGAKCCIPPGIFPVTVGWSAHFERMVPKIENVPGRTLIEIHWGNLVSNTLGCILVGEEKSHDAILASVAAFETLFDRVKYACLQAPVQIEIR